MLVMIGLSGAASSFADGYVESEKVYVTTDRHVYTPGERLSFSVFVVDEGHKVQKESAMVKVLLVDGKEQAIDSVVAHVLNGRFSYFFMLPKNGGIYRIKASTRWQLNELKPQQFQKEIFVQQVIQKKFFIAQSFTKTNYIQGDSKRLEFDLQKEVMNQLLGQILVLPYWLMASQSQRSMTLLIM